MKINTKHFGQMEFTEESIITFVSPLYGFDEYSKFVIIENEEVPGIVWLQSCENEEVCLIMISPQVTTDIVKYKKYISEKELEKIGSPSEFECWLVMVVKDTIEESTVNLKSPIVINLENSQAMQVILEEDFPVRCFAFEKKKED